jgi:hypothetical protein
MGDGCWTCAVWLPVGLNLGASSRRKDGDSKGAFLLGGEVSLLDMRSPPGTGRFWGGYVDTTYDTGAGLLRSSLGPEMVLLVEALQLPVGFDVGPLLEWSPEKVNLGGRVRLFLPVVYFTPYLGFTLLGTHEASTTVEGGILLKYPILVDE